MRPLILVLFVVLTTAAALPASHFGGPRGCPCNCPNPGLGNDLCAREKGGPPEMFPSRCYLECYNCTHGREYVVIRTEKCRRRR